MRFATVGSNAPRLCFSQSSTSGVDTALLPSPALSDTSQDSGTAPVSRLLFVSPHAEPNAGQAGDCRVLHTNTNARMGQRASNVVSSLACLPPSRRHAHSHRWWSGYTLLCLGLHAWAALGQHGTLRQRQGEASEDNAASHLALDETSTPRTFCSLTCAGLAS